MHTANIRFYLAPLLTVIALGATADELTIEHFDDAVAKLEVTDPTSEKDPLSMNAALVAINPGPGDTVMAVIKLKILPSWYIYETVPPSQPFIETKWILENSAELEPRYDWAGPPATPHKAIPEIKIHASSAKELLFFHEMKVADTDSENASATVGLEYQICNPEYCLPVKTKAKDLTIALSQ